MRVKDQPDLQYWLQTGAGLPEAPPEPQELQLAGQTSLQPSPGSALYKLTVGQVGPAGGRESLRGQGCQSHIVKDHLRCPGLFKES